MGQRVLSLKTKYTVFALYKALSHLLLHTAFRITLRDIHVYVFLGVCVFLKCGDGKKFRKCCIFVLFSFLSFKFKFFLVIIIEYFYCYFIIAISSLSYIYLNQYFLYENLLC